MGYSINHCEQRDNIKRMGLSSDDFKEVVLVRVGAIVSDAQSGKQSKPHKLAGVEMVAQVIAHKVLHQGARELCNDFDVNLDRLAEHASATHISSC